jgi:hypothetical protein
LKGVLGVGLVAQHATADVEDHRAVPPQEDLERRLVPRAEEPPEQFPVGSVLPLWISTDPDDERASASTWMSPECKQSDVSVARLAWQETLS